MFLTAILMLASMLGQPAAPGPLAPFEPALSTLDPAKPTAYLELGEEIADVAGEDAELSTTARTLFVLAFDLARAKGDAATAASACTALARMETLDRDRRWLVAVAQTLDARYKTVAWSRVERESTQQQTSLRAAVAIGAIRSGDGVTARRMLEDATVRDLLAKHQRLLTRSGLGGLSQLDQDARRWPCRECAGQRVVRRPGSSELRLCPNCNGNPGPDLTRDALVAQLRVESSLLNGVQRSWAAQLAADGGEPLRDPDAAEVAPTYGVDPGRPLWRKGTWTAAK
jgi:hypothetical protein